jgi:FkbM family methyltransferase
MHARTGPARTAFAWPRRVARVAVGAGRLAADARSLRSLARLEMAPAPDGEVELRLRPLGGRAVALRPGTSDADVLWDTFFHGYHLPPHEAVERGLRVIWDLGANVGLTMAHMAALYPQARVLGAELDPDNARLARRNVAAWGERCEVVECAVWVDDGEVRYHHHDSASGYNVVADDRPEGDRRAPARALGALLREHSPAQPVDYMKMDVEGSEFELLKRNTDWADTVRAIQVEAHFGYSLDECERDLRRLGFATRRHERHPASIVGLRD